MRLRGQAMQEAVPAGVGAMAAILGLEDQVIIDTCKKVSDDKFKFGQRISILQVRL